MISDMRMNNLISRRGISIV